jgi:hypothetical protein
MHQRPSPHARPRTERACSRPEEQDLLCVRRRALRKLLPGARPVQAAPDGQLDLQAQPVSAGAPPCDGAA